MQQLASWSIFFTSHLFRFLRPLNHQQAQDKLFHVVTIEQLQEMAPAIDWLSCLQATFTPMSLNSSQTLVVHDLDYLRNMSQLIQAQLPTSRDMMQSYMILGLVETLSPALDSQFQEARRELSQKLWELTKQPPMPAQPRWMKCVENTGAFFQPTLAALFVREAFGWSTRHAVCERSPLLASPHPSHPTHPILVPGTVPCSVVCVINNQAEQKVTGQGAQEARSIPWGQAQSSRGAPSIHQHALVLDTSLNFPGSVFLQP